MLPGSVRREQQPVVAHDTSRQAADSGVGSMSDVFEALKVFNQMSDIGELSSGEDGMPGASMQTAMQYSFAASSQTGAFVLHSKACLMCSD